MTSESITSNPLRACSGKASLSRVGQSRRDNFPLVLEHHQNNKDIPVRKRIISRIKKLLEKKSGNKWVSESKLGLVKRIELNLYESSFTLEEYSDMSTLKERIIALARKALVS